MALMSLALFIFLLVFVTELISWIGHGVLLDFAYALHQRIFNASTASRQRALKADILAKKAELLQTSAQDEFAKWAKLRRKMDAGLAELEKLNAELGSSKTSFSIKFKGFVWVLTTGTQFVVGWWYRKSAVFYLPPGWLGPLTWWMAFPFAPAGSISCGAWQMACRRLIKVGERVAKDLAGGHSTTEPVAVPVEVESEKTEKAGAS